MPKKHDKAPVEISRPNAWTAPCIFVSPHSGRYYPPHFKALSKLDDRTLRRSEDAFVDELFAEVTDFGAPLVKAVYPRAYVDLNRGPEELDPRMYRQPLSGLGIALSERVKAGLGIIPRVVAAGVSIYGDTLDLSEAETRLSDIYRPFHHALSDLRQQSIDKFGFALIIDCHSMPTSAFEGQRGLRHEAIDVVIGDRFGTSCSATISDWIEEKLNECGLKTARNSPYAGGYNTRVYGELDINCHAIQLEVARAAYMDETLIEKTPGFAPLQSQLTKFLEALCIQARYWAEERPELSQAAE